MKYRAFISYRRQDASAAARWLRSNLLGFRPPKELLDRVTPEQRADLEQRAAYFLDTSYQSANEDFWANNIEPALKESEYLIVVASPAALLKRPDGSDNWVVREIDTFLEQRKGDDGPRRIILALAAGASEQDIPERLKALSDKWDWVDLRAVSRFAWLRAGAAEQLGEALTKIVARLHRVPQALLPILTREEARKRGRLRVAVGALTAIVMIVLSGALGWAVVERGSAIEQRDQARRAQARLIAQLARTTLERGDSGTALALALEALPRHGGDPAHPYVVEAERALREVLMAPTRERRVLRVEGHIRLLDLLDGGMAVLQESRERQGSGGATQYEPVALHVLDAPGGKTLAVLKGHSGLVSDLAVSPDGRLLLSGSDDGTARLWDLASQSQRAEFGGHKPYHSMRVALSRDGRLVVTALQDGTVRLWRVAADGKVGPPRLITTCAPSLLSGPTVRFSPDEAVLAIACSNGLRLFSLARERDIVVAPAPYPTIWDAAPEIAFAGGRVYVASLDRRQPHLLAWDAESGSYDGYIPTSGVASNLQGSPDGVHMLATVYDTALLWPGDGRPPVELRHPLRVEQARMLADGKHAVTLTYDGIARLWDASGKLVASWRGFAGIGEANRLALSKDETALVLSERLGQSIHVWDIANRDVVVLPVPPPTRPPDLLLPNPSAPAMTALAVSADGSRIAAGFLDGRAVVWRASDGGLIATIDAGQSRTMMSLQFSPTDSRRLLSTAEQNDARLWNADTGALIARLTDTAGNQHFGVATFAGNGQWIAGGLVDGLGVMLWHGRSGAYVRTLPLEQAHRPVHIALLSFSPDSRALLAAGPARRGAGPAGHLVGEGTAGLIFSGADWAQSVPVHHAQQWRSAALTADAAAILVAIPDQVRLLGPRGEDGLLVGEHKSVVEARFAPDGRTVLSRFAGEVRVWSPDAATRFVPFETGTAAYGHQAVFSPDSTRLLIATSDEKAQLWDLPGPALLAALPLEEPVRYMRFTEGGIVTGSGLRALHLWRYPRTTEALLADACARLTRPLSREQRRAFLLDEDPRDPPCFWHPDMKDKPRR